MAIKRVFGVSPGGGGPDEGGTLSHLERIIACEARLEEAVHYLAGALAEKPRKGKKPVVLHSIRVGYKLLALGYDMDVVVAGLLHDLLEKTTLGHAAVARRFGPEVGLMVQAVTNDPRIGDALERYADSLRRCAAYGEGALLVRAADLLDNADRLLVLGSPARLERIAEKTRMLVKICREELVDERVVDELLRRYRRISRKVGGLALVPKKHQASVKASRLSPHHK